MKIDKRARISSLSFGTMDPHLSQRGGGGWVGGGRRQAVSDETSWAVRQGIDLLYCFADNLWNWRLARSHEIIFVDEAGFNLTKRKRRGSNIFGHRAMVYVPGQLGGNVTMCATISQQEELHRHAILWRYNTMLLLAFLREHMFQMDLRIPAQPEQPNYVVVWDNVSFHRTALVRDWFTNNPNFPYIFLPAYSRSKPDRGVFSAWWWKVYDGEPYMLAHILQAMEEACLDISVVACQGWIRHARILPSLTQNKDGMLRRNIFFKYSAVQYMNEFKCANVYIGWVFCVHVKGFWGGEPQAT